MSQSKKIRVAVLYGGRSGEHEVSLVSATNVIQNLDRTKFEVIPIGIDKQGAWFLGDDILHDGLNAPNQALRLQREQHRQLFAPTLIGQSIHDNQLKATTDLSGPLFDIVFPVIHGPLCEDGTIQGFLELANIPYVGCGVLASAIGMDKDMSKRLVQAAGIPIVPYEVIKLGQWKKNPDACCATLTKQLGYPMFVKPCNAGSSVGIHKVKSPEALKSAIDDAFKYDTKILIEKGMDVLEIELAVLESLDYGSDPIVSIPGQIQATEKHEFYSYASKYLDEQGADLFIPALISPELTDQVKVIAKTIFEALDAEGMARVDLFIERGTNKIYFNEINTIPGFTQISMYPKLMLASGISYTELLTHLILLAKNRHARKSGISYEYVAE